MRKFTQLALLATVLVATPAFATVKIAVLSYQMALLESDEAKRYAIDSEKRFGPQLTKIKTLEKSAKSIQDRLVSGGDKVQQGERERLELEFKQKARDYQFQSKKLNEDKDISDRKILKKLKPKLDRSVGAVIRKGSFDIVFDRSAVVNFKPQYDITRQVIELMNQLK